MLLAVVALALAGCAAYQPVQLRDGAFPPGAVQVGDDVRAETIAGETLAFEVVNVEGGSAMTSDGGRRVVAGDLASLLVTRRDKHKTQVALSVLGGVLAAAWLIDSAETTVVCVQFDTDVCGDLLRR